MTSPRRVLVLGDSALASVGACLPTAVDILASSLRCDQPVEIVNGSSIGMTSADARAHFDELSRSCSFDVLIVHVGNCDSCGFGPPKPAIARWFRQARLRRLAGVRRRGGRSRRTPPGEIRDLGPMTGPPEPVVGVRDFERHVRILLEAARRRGTRVLLLNPTSQESFPPCANVANASFVQIAGMRHGAPARCDDRAIEDAWAEDAAGATEALSSYQRAIEDGSAYGLAVIAATNRAAILATEGDCASAHLELDRVSPGHSLTPLVMFSRAAVFHAEGRRDVSDDLIRAAFARDTGTYRVSNAHRRVLASLADLRNVDVLDLGAVLTTADVLDYCHPTVRGHEQIASAVQSAMGSLGLDAGDVPATYHSLTLNPDRYVGRTAGVFDYFGVCVAPDDGFTRRVLDEATRAVEPMPDATQSRSVDPTTDRVRRLLSHPLFGVAGFLDQHPPNAPVDQGALPELHALRHLRPLLDDEPVTLPGLTPNPTRLDAWWPSLGMRAPVPERKAVEATIRNLDLNAVLSRAARLLLRVLDREIVVFERCRTIPYWFLREALLFGTASDPSQFIDRVELQQVWTTVLALRASITGPVAEAVELGTAVEALVDTHVRYLSQYTHPMFRVPTVMRRQYRADLSAVSRSQKFERVRRMADAVAT